MKYLSSLILLVTCLGSALAYSGNEPNQLALFPKRMVSTNYSTAFGMRGFGTTGLTIKHFYQRNVAIEGILGFGPDAFSLTILVENHVNAFDEPGLNWYYGIGGHIASETQWGAYYNRIRGYERAPGDFGMGVDGIFGMEYKIAEVPIAISVDMKPFVEITTRGNLYMAIDPGIGIKFTF